MRANQITRIISDFKMGVIKNWTHTGERFSYPGELKHAQELYTSFKWSRSFGVVPPELHDNVLNHAWAMFVIQFSECFPLVEIMLQIDRSYFLNEKLSVFEQRNCSVNRTACKQFRFREVDQNSDCSCKNKFGVFLSVPRFSHIIDLVKIRLE